MLRAWVLASSATRGGGGVAEAGGLQRKIVPLVVCLWKGY